MLKRIAIGIGAILVGAVAYIYFAYGSVARGGSGYAAKNICSGYFLSRFSPEVIRTEALAGASSILADVSYTIDDDAKEVTTRPIRVLT